VFYDDGDGRLLLECHFWRAINHQPQQTLPHIINNDEQKKDSTPQISPDLVPRGSKRILSK
jgi:hypothetical protein